MQSYFLYLSWSISKSWINDSGLNFNDGWSLVNNFVVLFHILLPFWLSDFNRNLSFPITERTMDTMNMNHTMGIGIQRAWSRWKLSCFVFCTLFFLALTLQTNKWSGDTLQLGDHSIIIYQQIEIIWYGLHTFQTMEALVAQISTEKHVPTDAVKRPAPLTGGCRIEGFVRVKKVIFIQYENFWGYSEIMILHPPHRSFNHHSMMSLYFGVSIVSTLSALILIPYIIY